MSRSINIYEAIKQNQLEKIKEYIETLENPLLSNVLKFALQQNPQKDIISLLTKKGVKKEKQESFETNLLHIACEKSADIEIIQILINLKYDPNGESVYTKQTPLHVACKNKNSLSVIQLLVQQGAQIDKVDIKGYIPVFYALENLDLDVIKFLLQNLDCLPQKKPNHMNILHFALSEHPAHIDLIEYILSFHVNPNDQDLNLKTPLHYACANACEASVLNLLIEKSEIAENNFLKNNENLQKNENFQEHERQVKIVNVFDINKQTPLHELCINKCTEDRLSVLLKAGADPNIQNPKKETAFHLVLQHNPSLDVVKMFIGSGASLEIQDLDGKTPLYEAIEHNAKDEVVYELISKTKNFKIAEKRTNTSLLHLAIQKSREPELIKMLIEKGVVIDSEDSMKKAPLHYCIEHKKREEVVEILLATKTEKLNSADLQDNKTILHLLCEFSTNAELIKTLISKGADPLASDNAGQTPLHLACINNPSAQVINVLLQSGADPKTKNRRRQLPLHLALEANAGFHVLEILLKSEKFSGSKEIHSFDSKRQTLFEIVLRRKYPLSIIKLFIDNGVMSEKIIGRGGQTYLHFACFPPIDPEIIALLLKKGADPDAKNNMGKTPLILAFMNKANKEVLHLLVTENNFDTPTNTGKTPLFFASANNNIEMMKYLISKGAQIHAHDKKGRSVFHYAIKKGAKVDVIQLLLENKADPNEIVNNMTALEYCFVGKESPVQVVELLLKICRFDSSIHNPLKKAFILALEKNASFFNLCALTEAGIDLATFKNNYYDFNHYIFSNNFDQFRLALSFDFNIKIGQYTTLSRLYQEVMQDFYSIMDDFERVLESGELSDFNAVCSDGSIPVHKLILKNRICFPDEKITFEKVLDILHSGLCDFQMNEVRPFLRFIYSGYIDHKDDQYEEKIMKIGSLFNLQHDWFVKKKGRHGLLKDMERLWNDDESKDFVVVVEDERIRLHKVILLIRSELFRGLFLSVDDPSNQVNEYSGKSIQTIKQLFKFFYLDELDPVLPMVVVSEIEEALDFYQGNEKTLTWKILYNEKCD